MKKICFVLCAIAIFNNAAAQIITNLIVSGTPPATLSEWSNRKETLVFQVQAGQGLRIDYKIKTEIKLLDGTVVGKNDLAKASIYTLGSTAVLYSASEVLALENMLFSGKHKSAMEKTGKLLSDNYQICVRLVRATDFTPVSDEKCRTFYLAGLQLPILMKPAADEELDAKMANTVIIFRWTPLVPRPATPVTYRLMVFEVLQNQNPVQAMRSNMPVLNTDVISVTQYNWQTQGIINCCPEVLYGDSTSNQTQKAGISTSRSNIPRSSGKKSNTENNESGAMKYVWTIQALDAAGRPLGDGNINGDGVSEPVSFYIKEKTKPAKE